MSANLLLQVDKETREKYERNATFRCKQFNFIPLYEKHKSNYWNYIMSPEKCDLLTKHVVMSDFTFFRINLTNIVKVKLRCK